MRSSSFYPLIILLLSAALVLWAYSFGWSGTWHFDDKGALNSLTQVFANGTIDLTAAWFFILEGTAGPLGRPVSLASFLLDGSGWPHHPDEMLRTNSFLHILNGLLLFLVFFRICCLKTACNNKSAWIASCAAIIWLLLPIHASASLMAVQRMTVLACSFMLLGLWLYLLGRGMLSKQSLAGWFFMLVGLGLGTVLGALSKEQALLLPTMVWVMEAWLLKKPELLKATEQKLWLAFKVVAFYLPTFFILWYLAQRIPGAENAYAGRNFDLSERLWTQTVILWDYLRLALLPRASSFGPFHDDYRIFTLEPASIMALTAWLLALALAWLYRKKSRLPMFALLWFLAAHLIESTVIGLELYFEHRNYLAVAGVIFAIVYAAFSWAEKQGKMLAFSVGIAAYALMQLFMLFQVTTLFGQPALAAEIWHLEHPNSARATQYIVLQSLEQGEQQGALRILDRAADSIPNTPILRMQSLLLSCELGVSSEDSQERFKKLLTELPTASKQFNASSMLLTFEKMHSAGLCSDILSADNRQELALTALKSKVITASSIEKANLHVFLANGFIEKRDLQSAMENFIAALKVKPDVSILQQAAAVLISAGLAEEALELFSEYPPRLPKNPWLKKKEQEKIAILKQTIEQAISHEQAR